MSQIRATTQIKAFQGLLHSDGSTVAPLKTNLSATTNPTTTDDTSAGYAVGSRWVNVSTDKEYVCLDATTSAAVWKELTFTVTGTPDGTKFLRDDMSWQTVLGGGSNDGCSVYRTSGQTFSASTWTAISWQSELFDTASMWASSPNPTRIVAPSTGYMLLGLSASISGSGFTYLRSQIWLNGASVITNPWTDYNNSGGSWRLLNTIAAIPVTSGDYIEAYVYSDAGSTLAIEGGNTATLCAIML